MASVKIIATHIQLQGERSKYTIGIFTQCEVCGGATRGII